jgi:hypothetical protein
MILQPTTTVYAGEEDELSKYNVYDFCCASQDYEAPKEQCDKLYDMLESII